MKTFDETLNLFLADHQEQYRQFSKLILSLSTGSIGVLTAFKNNWVGAEDVWLWSAQTALILLLVSFFTGLAMQHILMVRPSTEANQLLAFRAKIESSEDAISFSRKPSVIERIVFNFQLISFYAAISLVVLYVVRNSGNA